MSARGLPDLRLACKRVEEAIRRLGEDMSISISSTDGVRISNPDWWVTATGSTLFDAIIDARKDE